MGVWRKRRQRRLPFFPDLSELSPAVGSAVKKYSTGTLGWGSNDRSCTSPYPILSVTPTNFSRSFFSQAAALSPLRVRGVSEPPQFSLRERSF